MHLGICPQAQIQVRPTIHQKADLLAGPQTNRTLVLDHGAGKVGTPGT